MTKVSRYSEMAGIVRRYFKTMYIPGMSGKIPGMEVLKHLQSASDKIGDVWLNYLDISYEVQTHTPLNPKAPLVSVDLRSTADRQTQVPQPDNITPSDEDCFFRYTAFTHDIDIVVVKTREDALLEIEFYNAAERAYKRGWPFALFAIELRPFLAMQRNYRFCKDGEHWILTLTTPGVPGHYVLTFRHFDVRDLQHLDLSDR